MRRFAKYLSEFGQQTIKNVQLEVPRANEQNESSRRNEFVATRYAYREAILPTQRDTTWCCAMRLLLATLDFVGLIR